MHNLLLEWQHLFIVFFLLSSEQYIMQMYFKQMEFILNRLH